MVDVYACLYLDIPIYGGLRSKRARVVPIVLMGGVVSFIWISY